MRKCVLLGLVLIMLGSCASLKRSGKPAQPSTVLSSLPERYDTEERISSRPAKAPPWVYANVTRGEDETLYFTGLSRKFASEQEARNDALKDAREQIATYLRTDIRREIREVTSMEGRSSEILEVAVALQEITKLLSEATLVGTAAQEFYVERWQMTGPRQSKFYWKAYTLVPFSEKKNEEFRQELMRTRAEQMHAQVDQNLLEIVSSDYPKDLLRQLREKQAKLRQSFNEGKYSRSIALARKIFSELAKRQSRQGGNPIGEEGKKPHSVKIAPASSTSQKPSLLITPQIVETVMLEVQPSSQYFLSEGRDKLFLKIDILTPEIPIKNRLPLNLALVLDKSGSMSEENKIEYLKEAVKTVIDNLHSSDFLSIVIYNKEVTSLFDASRVINKEFLKNTVDGIVAEGRTNLSGGLFEGYAQVMKNRGDTFINRVLLLSDGLANEGITETSQLNKIVSRFYQQGVSVSTIGMGTEYDENLLLGLAEQSKGNYYFVKSPDDTPEFFRKELGELMRIVAQNTTVTVQVAQGWKLNDVYGYHFTKGSENTFIIKLGDLPSDVHKILLMELEPDGAPFSKETQFSIEMVFDDVLVTGGRITKRKSLIVYATDKPGLVQSNGNQSVMKQVWLVEGLRTLECVLDCLNRNDFSSAKHLLEEQYPKTLRYAQELEDDSLLGQANIMKEFLIRTEDLSSDGKLARDPVYGGLLRKELQHYWYARSKNKDCPHCKARHRGMDMHKGISH